MLPEAFSSSISTLTKPSTQEESMADMDSPSNRSHHLDDLLTPEQASKMLMVTEGTLAVWRSTGRYELKYVKVGRWVRYRYGDLLDFLNRRTLTQVS
ncbi:helix-turn-helix domain-containing protein [Endozoicomonas elysicola]|uniref:helix-turn-helix domain-containing protein n=2 Tax=Endozoicomonas elysicola TaxID=305900 RepID=UPI00036B793F